MSNQEPPEPWHGTVTDYPDLYDQYHANYLEDLPFYLETCHGCEDILECGAGTGRLSVPLARAGHNITALDSSLPMLKTFEDRVQSEGRLVADKIEIVHGDMTNIDLQKQFSCIIVPFMTFNYLPTTEAQILAFSTFSKHLRHGGLLIIDFMSMHPNWVINSDAPETISHRKMQDGSTLTIDRYISGDLPMQIVEQKRLYRIQTPNGAKLPNKQISWRNRIVSLGEIRLLHYSIDFRITKILGGYKNADYSSDSLNCITIATREA